MTSVQKPFDDLFKVSVQLNAKVVGNGARHQDDRAGFPRVLVNLS